jgi:hypothetical protein
MLRKAVLVACAATLFHGSAALAAAPATDVVLSNGVTRAELTKVLTSHGMTVTDATENEADPWLKAKTPKGTEFAINMFDCKGVGAKEQRCNTLQFLSQWELNKQTSFETANRYNQKFVFGRAYLAADEKTFLFDYSIKLKDGVTVANLKNQVDNWLRVLDDVRSMLKV